jgi:hypothetical protein
MVEYRITFVPIEIAYTNTTVNIDGLFSRTINCRELGHISKNKPLLEKRGECHNIASTISGTSSPNRAASTAV